MQLVTTIVVRPTKVGPRAVRTPQVYLGHPRLVKPILGFNRLKKQPIPYRHTALLERPCGQLDNCPPLPDDRRQTPGRQRLSYRDDPPLTVHKNDVNRKLHEPGMNRSAAGEDERLP